MYITKKDMGLITIIGFLFIIFHLVGWWLFGEVILSIGLGIIMMGMLFLSLEIYRRIDQFNRKMYQFNKRMHRQYQNMQLKNQNMQLNHYKQLEALFSVFFTLRPDKPLPDTGGSAVLPDMLKKIAEVIYHERPDLVVEASSGISTLISAYCLKNIGKGKIISLEHDSKYAAISQELIATHGLQDIATVIYAPLKEFEIQGQQWLWYDISRLDIDKPIDLLLIDGPPYNIQDLARYPALPLLFDKLNGRATIILDDGGRLDEQEIVKLWLKEFNDLQSEYLPLQKGAYIIRMNDKTDSA